MPGDDACDGGFRRLLTRHDERAFGARLTVPESGQSPRGRLCRECANQHDAHARAGWGEPPRLHLPRQRASGSICGDTGAAKIEALYLSPAQADRADATCRFRPGTWCDRRRTAGRRAAVLVWFRRILKSCFVEARRAVRRDRERAANVPRAGRFASFTLLGCNRPWHDLAAGCEDQCVVPRILPSVPARRAGMRCCSAGLLPRIAAPARPAERGHTAVARKPGGTARALQPVQRAARQDRRLQQRRRALRPSLSRQHDRLHGPLQPRARVRGDVGAVRLRRHDSPRHRRAWRPRARSCTSCRTTPMSAWARRSSCRFTARPASSARSPRRSPGSLLYDPAADRDRSRPAPARSTSATYLYNPSSPRAAAAPDDAGQGRRAATSCSRRRSCNPRPRRSGAGSTTRPRRTSRSARPARSDADGDGLPLLRRRRRATPTRLDVPARPPGPTLGPARGEPASRRCSFHALSRRLAHHVELFLSEARVHAPSGRRTRTLPIAKIQLRFIKQRWLSALAVPRSRLHLGRPVHAQEAPAGVRGVPERDTCRP